MTPFRLQSLYCRTRARQHCRVSAGGCQPGETSQEHERPSLTPRHRPARGWVGTEPGSRGKAIMVTGLEWTGAWPIAVSAHGFRLSAVRTRRGTILPDRGGMPLFGGHVRYTSHNDSAVWRDKGWNGLTFKSPSAGSPHDGCGTCSRERLTAFSPPGRVARRRDGLSWCRRDDRLPMPVWRNGPTYQEYQRIRNMEKPPKAVGDAKP